jgi:hypothetical protein
MGPGDRCRHLSVRGAIDCPGRGAGVGRRIDGSVNQSTDFPAEGRDDTRRVRSSMIGSRVANALPGRTYHGRVHHEVRRGRSSERDPSEADGPARGGGGVVHLSGPHPASGMPCGRGECVGDHGTGGPSQGPACSSRCLARTRERRWMRSPGSSSMVDDDASRPGRPAASPKTIARVGGKEPPATRFRQTEGSDDE